MNSSEPLTPPPVAIIGMGCLFPQAEDLARYWSHIRKGVDAITEVPDSHWSAADYFDPDPKAPDRTYAHRGGFLAPVDFPALEFGITPHAIEATDTSQLLGLIVARQALDDAGYGPGRSWDRDRASVILGVTGTLELVIPLGARLGHPIWRRALAASGVDPQTAEEVVGRIAASYVGWQENSFPGLLGNVVAGRIANRLDLRGTNCVVDAACASSLGAVHLALLELAAGRCDLAITGGLDTFNDIFMYMCFSKTPALSPSGDARPFDADADGTILGEGLGVLVLKRLADARRDGDRIYAVIRSVGASSDGKGQAVYAPSAAGQVKALRQAYRLAGISPATVELLEAHGTGTRIGDATELAALEEVYREAGRGDTWCALGSVKSQVGHTKAAAGAAGLIKAAMALYHKVLPPTLKVRRPVERLAGGDSPFYLNTEARPWLTAGGRPRRAGLSAFGFGGSNFHCVLEEAEPAKPAVDWDGDVQILAFSADEPAEIARSLQALEGPMDWPAVRAAARRSRAQFRSGHRQRLVVVAERGQADWDTLLAAARSRLAEAEAGRLTAPGQLAGGAPGADGRGPGRILVGIGQRPGRLALLFPGQGSQYVGMVRELACLFPRMHQALSRLEAGDGHEEEPGRVSERIYPPPSFDDGARAAAEEDLRRTQLAQPAIGAVSLGLLRILGDFGIQPDLVGGHSFGELTALCAAGRLDDDELAMLARRRGALMAGCGAEGSGAMLAVFAPADEVADLIQAGALDLVLANVNAPRQCVLSGPEAEIRRIHPLLAARRIASRPVPVSGAFHSRFVAGALGPFRRALDAVAFPTSSIPVFANATAEPYPDDPESARELLSSQLVRPVEFVAQVEAMYRQGARAFLEVGPGATLTGLVRSILEGRAPMAMAVDASRGTSGNLPDLACALATLAALGYAVNLDRWDEGGAGATPEVPARRPGLTVRISGANARPKEGPLDAESLPVRGTAARAAPEPSGVRGDPPPPRPVVPAPMNSVSPQPQDHSENDRTMNLPQRLNSHHSNGQAGPHAGEPSPTAREPEPSSQGHPPLGGSPASPGVATVLEAAQENLAALQRMAARTADLHRQFLEGQEKTQAAFLRLLEDQQRLSRSRRLESAGALALRTVRDGVQGGEGPAVSLPAGPVPHLPGMPAGPEPRPSRSLRTPGPMPARFDGWDDRQARTAPVEPGPAPMPGVGPGPLATAPNHPGAASRFLKWEGAAPADPRGAEEMARQEPRPPQMPAPGTDAEAWTTALIEVVAEKTGYPVEMLELDMELDGDLGIDSIKRVEILSALQDRLPELSTPRPQELGSFPTLRAIAEYLDRTRTAPPRRELEPAAESRVGGSEDLLARTLLETVAEKTGYPVAMLELDMRLDGDLGIDSIKRVEILSALQDRLPSLPATSPERIGTLGTLREIVDYLEGGEFRSPGPARRSHPPLAVEVTTTEPATADAAGTIARILHEVVAEKTGYPVEMLELDMELDGDLGIDSIKRVEILSALQDRLPALPTIGPERAGTIRTLRQIIEHLSPPPCPAPPPVENGAPPAGGGEVGAGIVHRNGTAPGPGSSDLGRMSSGLRADGRPAAGPSIVLRRWELRPVPLPAPDRRAAVRLRPGGTVAITDEGSCLTQAVRAELLARGYRPRVIPIGERDPAADNDPVCGLIVLAPRGPVEGFSIAEAFRTVRAAGPALERAGQQGGAALMTVSRLDGGFGVRGLPPEIDPDSGALAGLAKTAGHEWPGVDCKAVDLDGGFEATPQAAASIVEELLTRGPAEVGLGCRGRIVLELVPVPVPDARAARRPTPRLGRGDLVVISGGARGITAEVAVALAAASQPRLLLLGRSPEPGPEEASFAACRDEGELKRALLSRRDGPRTPKALGDQARRILAGREIRGTLDRIAAAGSAAVYRSVDVRDSAAVRAAIARAREESGPVRGLIHAAGVLADRRIVAQTDDQFEGVYQTKVQGLHSLFRAMEPEALEFLVLFSSSSARLGRAGQGAYAAANEFLNKWAQQAALRLPACRVVSLNWGPWAGGMVTDGLRAMFEQEGLTLIPPEAGARVVLDEIECRQDGPAPGAVELVVLAERVADGSARSAPGPLRRESGPPSASPSSVDGRLDLAFDRAVDRTALPILDDHIIDGHAVLPMALILEWAAEGALQRQPGLVLCGVENLRLFKGVILGDQRGATVQILAGRGGRRGHDLVVPVELRGTLGPGREVIHARAEVVLGARHASGPRASSHRELPRYGLPREEIYGGVLFHGPGLRGIRRIEGCGEDAIAGWVATAPPPSEWVERPLRGRWLTDPLAIDSAFQLVVLWCREQLGANSLPTRVGSYRQFRAGFGAGTGTGGGEVRVLAMIRQASDARAVADIEFLDGQGEPIARLDGYECVIDASLNQAFRRNQLVSSASSTG